MNLLVPLDRRPLLERRRHAALLERRGRDGERLALDGGERVARLDLELVAPQVREDAVAVALEREGDLDACGRRAASSRCRSGCPSDRRERPVSSCRLYWTCAVDDEERPRELEGVRHLVLELDLGARPCGAAADDRVAEEREAGVATPDLVLELVDTLLEVAQAHRVRRAVHRLIRRRLRVHVDAHAPEARSAPSRPRSPRPRRARRSGCRAPRPTRPKPTPWSPSASRFAPRRRASRRREEAPRSTPSSLDVACEVSPSFRARPAAALREAPADPATQAGRVYVRVRCLCNSARSLKFFAALASRQRLATGNRRPQ